MLTPWSGNSSTRFPRGAVPRLGTEISDNHTKQAALPDLTPSASLPVLHLLVVDDDDPVREGCCQIAEKMGFAVRSAESVPSARAILKHDKVDLMLLDLKLPGGSALSLLEEVKSLSPDTSVVVMTAYATVSSAVEAMRIGAGDYLTKPFALDDLTSVLGRAGNRRQFHLESRRLRERLRNQTGTGSLIGHSPEMEKLYRILSKVANSNHPVMILGEAGTGKELVARSIHFSGLNASKPFIPVDCASLVPNSIEHELFGYAKGAFPGAIRAKEGLLAEPEGGTIFLDEISELTLELQSRLLRALQDKEIRPAGAINPVPITVRLLAASNRDLNLMVEQGRFRRDLYFRLNVVNLRIPALRDRREDIPVLAAHFLQRQQKETGTAYHFSDETLRLLVAYEWPGNVRELENAIDRACALSSGPIIHIGDLPTQLQDFRMQANAHRIAQINAATQDVTGTTKREANGVVVEQSSEPAGIVSIAVMERKAILGTIRQLKGDKLMAAKLLGIGKTTLYRKLKEYGISEED